LIEAGALIPEPREDQNKRIFVSVAALNNAGLEILDEPFRGGRSYVADGEVERLKAELETAYGEIAELRAQCEVLVSGVGRIEVALEGTRAAYDALRRVRALSTPPPPWLPTNPRRRSTDVDSDSLDVKRGSQQTR
jgi:hypothetical protein